MGIYLDEPLAALAAAAFTLGGAVVGAWWQRRRIAPPVAARDNLHELEARFDRLEEIAETTALQVERVAEGQRFTTRVLAEGRGVVAPPARQPERAPGHNTPH